MRFGVRVLPVHIRSSVSGVMPSGASADSGTATAMKPSGPPMFDGAATMRVWRSKSKVPTDISAGSRGLSGMVVSVLRKSSTTGLSSRDSATSSTS